MEQEEVETQTTIPKPTIITPVTVHETNTVHNNQDSQTDSVSDRTDENSIPQVSPTPTATLLPTAKPTLVKIQQQVLYTATGSPEIQL